MGVYLQQAPIASARVRFRRLAISVARHSTDDVPLAVFTLPGVCEPFLGSFAINDRPRTVQRDDGAVTVLAYRHRRQFVVRDFPYVDLRFVLRAWRIVWPSCEAIAPERFERFRVPAAHVTPVRLFLLPHFFFRRCLLCMDQCAE